MKVERRLTPKQRRFIEEYQVDLNASKAAVRAGYSPKWSNKQAHNLIDKNRQVAEEIQKVLAERSERAKIDGDFVIRRLIEESEREGDGASHSARVKALELLGRHIGLFPLRGSIGVSLDGQLDVNHETLLEGRRIARRMILEEIREEPFLLPEKDE